jgi:hypothetical protein
MSMVTWALLLANEGRLVVFEPFALICLLGAATSFVSSPGWGAALRSGLWIGLGFWTKQYALVGWAALLIEGLWSRRIAATLGLTAGAALGVAAGFGVLLALGTEPARLASLFGTRAYPPSPMVSNLTTAPDLIGILLLTCATLTRADFRRGPHPGLRVPVVMTAATLLPLYFRGYRHYWQLMIPFLVIVLMSPLPTASRSWAPAPRRGAILLIVLSVGLDAGRCLRDFATQARTRQRAEAEKLTEFARGSGPALYLVDPAVLAWVEAPIIAPREVGPKFTRISRPEAEALLSAAEVVVWDPTFVGADETLRRLARDPSMALRQRGFGLTTTLGPMRIYSRPK